MAGFRDITFAIFGPGAIKTRLMRPVCTCRA